MTPVFYKTVLEQNPALRRAEVRDAAALEQINGVAAAVPAAHAGIYALAMQRVKAAQQEQRELVTEQQGQVELAEENAAVMSDMVALPAEASQGESLVLAQASQAQREAPAPKSKSANSPEDEGFGFAWQGGIAALGLFALGGASNSTTVVESNGHDCDIDFNSPSRPTGATVETLSLAAWDSEVQASGSPMELAAGDSLVVALGAHSDLSGANGEFLVSASGNMGDLYIDVGDVASINMSVNVEGGVGNISMLSGKDTDNINVSVSAAGDVGNVTRLADGVEGSGTFNLDTTGGDVGQVEIMYANPSAHAETYISAYAAASGSALVGGNVGDVSLFIEGLTAQGSLYVEASGGDVGDLEAIVCGGSASGSVTVSAYAQIDGNGAAVGGNVGDVTLSAHGGSADIGLSAFAYGALSGGVYVGGGNIGNVLLSSEGYSAEADANLRAYSGGSIGTITLQVSSSGEDDYSVSANVNASAFGAGGQVAAIGDVTMDVFGGMDSSASVFLDAYSGGNIGSITATVTGGNSGQIDIYASAYANASGSGGNIGAVSLTETSWGGDHAIKLYADKSIGAVTASVGGGSADLDMRVNAGDGAAVGDISVAFDAEHFGDASSIFLGLNSGATGANISVTGGSQGSWIEIVANENRDGDADYVNDAKVAGDIDMSGFAGFAAIDLTTVVEGVSIEVGQGGSYVIGTLGADTITLGAGSDMVDFDNFDFLALENPTDSITGFDAIADVDDESDTMDAFFMFAEESNFYELTSDDATTLADDDVITLVDLEDGEDITTVDGLLAALNGGEYGSVDSEVGGGAFTFATATGTTATSFNLFHVEHDGTEFTNAYLLADVTMATGSTFADLSADNFVYYV